MAGAGGGQARRGLAYDWSPSGEEIHADIGQVLGAAQGLHLDTFDDWPLPNTFVDVPAAYQQLTRGMEFVVTDSEAEALLLENNLIKRFRPRFNVLLRDDKSFPYILISGDHTAPQILKHRGARNRPGDYFGPFASVWAVNRTITALERAFLIRSCSNAVYESRTRPCLLHQIKRCSAPCTGVISHGDYAKLVDEAVGFLSGRSQAVRSEMGRRGPGSVRQPSAKPANQGRRLRRWPRSRATVSAIQSAR